ncbi:unnamed protein product [Oikopleura dioica]|uniref:Uncharacterized protein n=1 Tax=Oikopleura dioica TaxID=34765 RepID=E4Y390_OIKDI|nr:unnamed protein product [Oikopleura dioica]
MANIFISGFQIKKAAQNSKRRRNKFILGVEKRRTDESCKARRTGRDNGSNMKKLLVMFLFDSI